MRFARIRLYIAAVLFVGWLSYLAYLALNFAHPMIVSRSQLMAADVPVVAEVLSAGDGKLKAEVVLVKDLRTGPKSFELPKELSVSNLAELKYPGDKPPQAGLHLLLLTRGSDGVFKVVATPPSPGDRGGRIFIYPWTSEVERQVEKWRE